VNGTSVEFMPRHDPLSLVTLWGLTKPDKHAILDDMSETHRTLPMIVCRACDDEYEPDIEIPEGYCSWECWEAGDYA
jgi:hypothetical protein